MSANSFSTWSNLGDSGLKVSNVIVGCMQYGSKNWQSWLEDDEEKIFGILKKCYDHGIRTFDTADVYSNGLSEVLLGKFLKKYEIPRDKVVIMTKVNFAVDESYGIGYSILDPSKVTPQSTVDFQNLKGLSRKHIFDAVKNSLRRLDTDYIDVYQIHRYDYFTPPKEFMRALNDVVEAGYVRYIGASSMKAVDFVDLQWIAESNGWHKFTNMQSKYSLLDREDEPELNYYCDKSGVGLTPYSPLARGLLARPVPENDNGLTVRAKSTAGTFETGLTKQNKERLTDIEIINRVGEVASKRGTKQAVVALAWLISKGAKPIVGISSESRVDDVIEATHFELTAEEIKYLEEPYQRKERTYGGEVRK